MLKRVARSVREKVVLALGIAAVAAIVAAFAIEVGPEIRFRWRLRGLADGNYDVRVVTAAWLLTEDPRVLRARLGALVPALERYVAEHPKEAAIRASVVLERMGRGDPPFLLRLRGLQALWPAAYRAILRLEAASVLPEDACEATLDPPEKRAGVDLFRGTQDRRFGSGWTLEFSGAPDVLVPHARIVDLGARPLDSVEALSDDDARWATAAVPCERGHTYAVSCDNFSEHIDAQFAVTVSEHVPGRSARIRWRVLKVVLE
jgi:hypothetical protein